MRLIGDYRFLGTVVYLLRLGLNHAPRGTVSDEAREKIEVWCNQIDKEVAKTDLRLDIRHNSET